jgi:ubiquinone biosynthesis protein
MAKREIRGALGLLRFGMKVSTQVAWGIVPAGVAQLAKGRSFKKLPQGIGGEMIASILQSTGPVFIKLGQILATRRDLLPEEVCEELERLYSKQQPLPRKALQKILKKKFGRKNPFRNLSRTALSVGSIGAVYSAETHEGEVVILKILRTGVEQEVARDLDVLRMVLKASLALFPKIRPFKNILQRSLESLAKALESELDLDLERSALQDFRKRLAKSPQIYIPKVYPEWSDAHLLVMERVDGVPLNEWKKSASTTEEKKRVAESALQEVMKQVLHDGRYHGDPHAGNILVMPDGKLAFIDFGLVGEFNDQDRAQMVRVMRAFISRDAEKVVAALLEFGDLPPEFNLAQFQAEVVAIVLANKEKVAAQLLGRAEGGEALESFVTELFKVSDRHGIYVPSEVSILIKTFVTIEGVARSLDPELNVLKVASPVVISALTPAWVRGITKIWKSR